MNARTEEMLAHAQQQLDRELVLDQGSYNPGGDAGDRPHHIHAIALSDPDLSSPAQEQATMYLGKNGLAGEHPDDGPEVTPIRTWEQYERAPR